MIIGGEPERKENVDQDPSRTQSRTSIGNGRLMSSAQTVSLSCTALVLDNRLSYAKWKAIGERIKTHAEATSWWLGDWLVFGEDHYGGRYARATELTGLEYKTLRNYSVVARRFPLSRRRDTLSFQHHAEVCALADLDQDRWLDLAEHNRWSKAELRRQIRQSARRPTPGDVTLRVAVGPDRRERWLSAADRCECGLGEWVAATLDAAAKSILGDPGAPDPCINNVADGADSG